jgi:NAD(P)-dependent dehydrogenase (short-subunit alcohol dehydrogenase family)
MKQVVAVTGGSKGIGLAIVKLFLAADFKVYNLDITASDIGEYVFCDMSNFAQVKAAIEKITALKSGLDILICNAGIYLSASIENTSEEDFDKLFAVNVKAAFAAIQASLPSMKAAQKGSIVLIGSDQSVIAKQNSFAYNLSKHALASLCKTTALDYAADNIRVNIVCPGTIETPLYHAAIDRYCETSGADKRQVHYEEAKLQPLGRLGQPEEVAEYVFFLASEKASFVTGSLQMIDGGYTTG